MKNVRAAAVLAAALCALATPARATVYGQFTGAAVVPVSGHVFGGYITASESVTGGLAQLRLSFYPNVDFGFQGGLSRFDTGPGGDLTILRLGTDLRWQVAHRTEGYTADISVGGALGVETAEDYKIISLGPTAAVSRGIGGPEAAIVPYAAMALLFTNRDAFGIESSDLSVPLRLGMEARLTPSLKIVAELQVFVADRFSDDVGFVAGANLPF